MTGALVSAAAIACGLDVTGASYLEEPDAERPPAALPDDVTEEPRVDASACDASVCVVAIAAEHLHTCAAIRGEPPRCWGANGHGELGALDASADASPAPLPVATTEVDLVAAGGFVGESRPFTCAASTGGQVTCWGDDSLGQRVTDAGDDAAARATPTRIEGVGAVSSLAAGGGHVCAGQADGGVSCWGYGPHGQLGRALDAGSLVDPTPAHVPLPRPAVAVAAGGFHSCALLDDRTIGCFGMGSYEQLGHPDASAPGIVPEIASAVDVTAGYLHTCAVLDDGTMRCWGYNASGQLGQGMPSGTGQPAPVLLPNGRRAKAACAGYLHSCALLDDGTVACWGFNARGQVGTGVVLPTGAVDVPTVLTPAVVEGLSGVSAVSCAGQHTCALHTNGAVSCWGANEHGQLGRGAADALPHPEPAAVVF